METIGTYLRAARTAAGLSQEAAAEAAGSVQTTISLVEVGARGVGVDLLTRLARVYQMSDAEMAEALRLAGAYEAPARGDGGGA